MIQKERLNIRQENFNQDWSCDPPKSFNEYIEHSNDMRFEQSLRDSNTASSEVIVRGQINFDPVSDAFKCSDIQCSSDVAHFSRGKGDQYSMRSAEYVNTDFNSTENFHHTSEINHSVICEPQMDEVNLLIDRNPVTRTRQNESMEKSKSKFESSNGKLDLKEAEGQNTIDNLSPFSNLSNKNITSKNSLEDRPNCHTKQQYQRKLASLYDENDEYHSQKSGNFIFGIKKA